MLFDQLFKEIENTKSADKNMDADTYQSIREKISGCLFGGALGDALGYAVEFISYPTIQKRYGKNGIQNLDLSGKKAIVSDDTQMTLFTMEGMLQGYGWTVFQGTEAKVEYYVYLSYLKWFQTQKMSLTFEIPLKWSSKLADVPEMNHLRAPGNTCLNALASGKMGTIEVPINNSKGCGGVMRTAPLGFTKAFGSALLNGAKVAAITHGHPLGWIPAGMLSDIIFKIIYGEKRSLREIIEDSLADTVNQFKDCPDITYFEQLMRKAIDMSETDDDDVTTIEALGGGWVGEEALAIAVYCCLKYSNDMKKMLAVSVNHGGDSDSTGAIAGNILGAYLGMDAIPKDWLDQLEMVDVIQNQIDGMMLLISEEWKNPIL